MSEFLKGPAGLPVSHESKRHSFAKTYLCCFLAVALLTIFSQVVMSLVASHQQRDGDALKRLDRLRLLSNRILVDAEGISLAAPGSEREHSVSKLKTDLDLFMQAETALDTARLVIAPEDAADVRARDLYVDMRSGYSDLIRVADTIVRQEQSGSALSPGYKANIRFLSVQEGLFSGQLESLLRGYRRHTDQRLDRLKSIDLGVGFLILCVLAVEFFFVFRPELRSLRKLSNSLEALNVELKEKNASLTEHGAKLAEQQIELMEQGKLLALKNSELHEKQEELESLNLTLDQTKDSYASAARQMEGLFQTIPVACFAFDKEGKIFEWNKAAETLFCFKAHEIVGQSLTRVLSGHMLNEDLDTIRRVFTGKAVEGLIWQHRPLGGDARWMLCSVHPVVHGDGTVQAAICCNVDISERMTYAAQLEESMVQLNEYSLELEMQRNELEDMNVKLEALATTDGLTGLRNHRNFHERLEFELGRAKEANQPLSVLLLDVDHFKKFNDTYGHPEGDKVLRAVAEVLRAYAQEPNTAARYGGEEFVLVLPGVSEENAGKVAEEIRAKIQSCDQMPVTITASFGLACWSADMRSRAELIAQADKALYVSKETGRNRVTHASSLWQDEQTDAA